MGETYLVRAARAATFADTAARRCSRLSIARLSGDAGRFETIFVVVFDDAFETGLVLASGAAVAGLGGIGAGLSAASFSNALLMSPAALMKSRCAIFSSSACRASSICSWRCASNCRRASENAVVRFMRGRCLILRARPTLRLCLGSSSVRGDAPRRAGPSHPRQRRSNGGSTFRRRGKTRRVRLGQRGVRGSQNPFFVNGAVKSKNANWPRRP